MVKEIIPREERLVRSLSWSKVSMWQKSKKQFMDTYFSGKEFFETKEIIFGSTLWNMIELWEYHDTEMIVDKVMRDFYGEVVVDPRKEKIVRQSIENIQGNPEFIQKVQEMSFDFWSEMETKMMRFIDDVCLIGFADNTTADWKMIKEFKTGKWAWTQSKVDEHWQLDFYCLMTYLEKWYLPDDVELTWFQTKDDWNWGITITGEIKTFKYDVEKFKDRILAWEKKIPEIFEEVMEAQLEWQKAKDEANPTDFDDNTFIKLAEIEKQKKELDEQAKELKKKIEENMTENNLKDYKMEGVGTIYYTTRKKWEYDDSIKNMEADFKKAKKDFETQNEPTESTSISFRFN